MKLSSSKVASLLGSFAALSLVSAAQAVTFNYASIGNANINFNGASQFSFSGASSNFQVTSGSANGLLGAVTGTYNIGAVLPSGGTNQANVTGTGSFIVYDGIYTLSGALTWVNISQTGTAGALNTVGAVNLTGITYGGSNADLLALKNSGSAINVLTFQFVPAVSLDLLKTTVNSTSFSGTVASTVTSVPDAGASVALLGFALAGLALARRSFSV